MINRYSCGCTPLDSLLQGGIEEDVLSIVFGPAGSGKTNLCMLASIAAVKRGKKVIYVDTEGGFSYDRFMQVCQDESVLQSILFFKPTSFEEQKITMSKLGQVINDHIGLIVIDTITHLYRVQMGERDRIYDVNRELGLQIQILSQIARNKKIPVLLANQVYAHFEQPNAVKMVGGDFLKYGAKCLIELQKGRGSIRRAILRKHRSISEEQAVMFKIVDNGFAEMEKVE